MYEIVENRNLEEFASIAPQCTVQRCCTTYTIVTARDVHTPARKVRA